MFIQKQNSREGQKGKDLLLSQTHSPTLQGQSLLVAYFECFKTFEIYANTSNIFYTNGCIIKHGSCHLFFFLFVTFQYILEIISIRAQLLLLMMFVLYLLDLSQFVWLISSSGEHLIISTICFHQQCYCENIPSSLVMLSIGCFWSLTSAQLYVELGCIAYRSGLNTPQ